MMEEKQKLTVRTVRGEELGLGAAVRRGEICFAAALDTDEELELVLYRKGAGEVLTRLPMPRLPGRGEMRALCLTGVNASALEYNLQSGGRIFQDPAARLVVGRTPFGSEAPRDEHQIRCGFAAAAFDWKDEQGPLERPYEEVVAYCLHVRGFTMQKNAGVRHPGTFKGLEEKIPYLRELGINQVILMPSYEFEEVLGEKLSDQGGIYPEHSGDQRAKLNFWGYGRGYYFAPKAGYAAGSAPDAEFKAMVRAMHLAGIEVVMEFAFTDELSMDYMIQCLSWWVREYHVDGFVLMARQEMVNLLARSPLLRRTKLMSGWFDTRLVYPHGRRTALRMLADINDGFKEDARRMLKGDEGQLQAFVGRMKQNGRDKACVNYITGHNGFTLMDLVSYDQKHNEENGEQNRDGSSCDFSWNCGVEGPTKKRSVMKLRMRQMKNAMTMLMLAQGTPMILAGDEFGNSQGGNNNPYCLDSEVSWVDWGSRRSGRELTDYVKNLIAFRQAHPVLHLPGELTGGDSSSCGYPDVSCHGSRAWYGGFEPQNRHVGLMYCGREKGGDAYIYVAYNLHWNEQEFALPYLPEGMVWQCVLDTAGPVEELKEAPVRTFLVPGRTVRVLVGIAVKDGKSAGRIRKAGEGDE